MNFEERLKEKVGKLYEEHGRSTGFLGDVWSLLQDALREQKEEIRKNIEDEHYTILDNPGKLPAYETGYNKALDDILTLLEGDGK